MRGRAILNGYIPYQDHLDVKAPGVIFIGALSLLITGDGRFEWALRIAILLAMPILFVGLAYRKTRSQNRRMQCLLILSSFLMGSELMLFTIAKGGNYLNNAEPFGIFFSLLYLMVVVWDRGNMSRLRLGLASLFLLCAIGMKEPFLLILLAVSIVLSQNMRFFVRSFLVPLGIALVAGTLILACLGYLTAYLTIDIPTILNDRMVSDYSLPFRGIMLFRIVEDITRYSPVGPIMGYFILLLWILHPIHKFEWKSKTVWMTVAAVFTLSSFVYFSGIFWVVWEKINYSFSFQSSQFQWLIIKYIVSLVILIPLLWILYKRSKKLFGVVLLSGIALYLTTIAIGSGNFLNQHFLLAIPVYAGIFFLFVENQKFLPPMFLIACAPFFHHETDYAQLILKAQDTAHYYAQYKTIAADADLLMDSCNFKQFYALGGIAGIGTYMKHSPTDLAYAETSDNVELRQRFMERLQMAPVIFTNDEYLNTVKDDDVRTIIQTFFTAVSPSCAQGMNDQKDRLMILFKNDPSDPKPLVELPALQLSHFIEEFNGSSPVYRQEMISISKVVLRELGIDAAASSITINVQREENYIRLIILDSSANTPLGDIVLYNTNGSIISKSVRPHP